MENDDYFDPKELKFTYNLDNAFFEMDSIQTELLKFYLRADKKFRRAFSLDFTSSFIQFIKDKARLCEPIHISTMGSMRGGKSEGMLTSCIIHQACYKKRFTSDYICGQSMEFLDKVQTFPDHKLKNRIFLVDEEKSLFSIGSMAKLKKLQDLNSIIAVNNISTIMINPLSWQDGKHSQYGFRVFGRDFNLKLNRFMMYDLQASQNDRSPLGLVYLPLKERLIPESYAKQINEEYLKKKMEWVERETRGNNDFLAELRKTQAINFMKDDQFLKLTKKALKLTYIKTILGSDYSNGECEEILNLISMIQSGIVFEKPE